MEDNMRDSSNVWSCTKMLTDPTMKRIDCLEVTNVSRGEKVLRELGENLLK